MRSFFTLDKNLDIIGLFFAIIVFLYGFFYLTDKMIYFSIRSIEFLGILFASSAILLMWHDSNNGNSGESNNDIFSPT